MLIGAHESVAGGLSLAYGRAVADSCECVQIFVRANRRWHTPPLQERDAQAFRQAHQDAGGIPTIAHDIYLVNMASMDDQVRQRSAEVFADEMDRCARLGVESLVFHAGSPRDKGEDWGLDTLARQLDGVLEAIVDLWGDPGTPSGGGSFVPLPVVPCVENAAGQGATLGSSVESIASLISRMDYGRFMGVCLDTCHAMAAGYPLHEESGWQELMGQVEGLLGLDRVRAFHLNDSKTPAGSRVDRHAPIGEGHIGLEGFSRVVNDPRLARVPACLETPGDKGLEAPYLREVELLKSLRRG